MGHTGDRGAVYLEGESFRLLRAVLLKVIRPQYGLNQIDVGRQNPVFIQIGNPLQALLNVRTNCFQS